MDAVMARKKKKKNPDEAAPAPPRSPRSQFAAALEPTHPSPLAVVSQLLSDGSLPVDQPDEAGNTPLRRAVAAGAASVIRLLVDANASVNSISVPDKARRTDSLGRLSLVQAPLLHCAVAHGHDDATYALITAKVPGPPGPRSRARRRLISRRRTRLAKPP